MSVMKGYNLFGLKIYVYFFCASFVMIEGGGEFNLGLGECFGRFNIKVLRKASFSNASLSLLL